MRMSNCSGANWPITLLGMLFAIIMQGCANEVVVKCGPGMQMAREGSDVVGACNSVSYTGSIPSGTICKNGSTQITCPAGATCNSGSTKCGSSPGSCGGRTSTVNCKTIWTQSGTNGTSGSCSCGCP
jgi:hypothetical protein